jgi:hypothetical protein
MLESSFTRRSMPPFADFATRPIKRRNITYTPVATDRTQYEKRRQRRCFADCDKIAQARLTTG